LLLVFIYYYFCNSEKNKIYLFKNLNYQTKNQKPKTMKKSLLFALMVLCGVAVMAQFRPAKISKALQNKAVLVTPAIADESPLTQSGNPYVNSKAVMDDILGTSGAYDMQSNNAPMQRVIAWPDGTVSASWMKADQSSYADRGTGYNYFDGSAWGAAPAARIETQKCGWPSLCKWNTNGEIVVSHNSTKNLVLNTRLNKGTGAWTESNGPLGPVGTGGTNVKILWPRTVTNGADHKGIHVICLTMPTANGGEVYNGMDGALLYYRSLDGGQSWDIQGIQPTSLTSANYDAIGGDDYSWIEPHGDTLAFLMGSVYNGTVLMKSFDNGAHWINQDVETNYYGKKTSTQIIDPYYGCDGTMAGAMDKNGVFHVAIGRMCNYQDASGSYWRPGTDGLVYWNSTEGPLDTAMMASIDSLDAHHKLIGYVAANGTDSIVGFPYYKGGLSSYPEITIDNWNNIYFLWSSLTVGNPDPTPYNYRHVWARAWYHDKAQWGDMIDLHSDFLYIYQEHAYPEVAKEMVYRNGGWNLTLLTQTSSQPGSNVVVGTTTYPPVPVHEVSFAYREIPESIFWPTAIKTNEANKNLVGQNFPNPVKGMTSFAVNVEKPANVIVEVSNIMGQKVMSMDKGLVNAGAQKYTIDCSSLTSGIYFYTVKINGESYTHKMIVE